jgi:diaminopimelate epimerase
LKIQFYKYQGVGNDFVMIDNRFANFVPEKELIEKLCDRNFGIGADGLILLENDANSDFQMVYFNYDGQVSTMCGNGGRCIVRFASDLGIIQDTAKFQAIDGFHEARIENEIIHLKMSNVVSVEKLPTHYFLNTGSPHHVEFVQVVDDVDVPNYGRIIRYGAPYFNEGTNVNFVETLPGNALKIRTYERGVEDETLACGTGVTAAAIAAYEAGKVNSDEVVVYAEGGELRVKFFKNPSGGFENVWLSGPAEFVFKGLIEVE